MIRKRVDVTDDHAVRGKERGAIRQPGPDRTGEMRCQESLLRIAGRNGACPGYTVDLPDLLGPAAIDYWKFG